MQLLVFIDKRIFFKQEHRRRNNTPIFFRDTPDTLNPVGQKSRNTESLLVMGIVPGACSNGQALTNTGILIYKLMLLFFIFFYTVPISLNS